MKYLLEEVCLRESVIEFSTYHDGDAFRLVSSIVGSDHDDQSNPLREEQSMLGTGLPVDAADLEPRETDSVIPSDIVMISATT